MDLPLSRIFSTILAVLFIAGISFKSFLPNDDPYRCRVVQNTGRWIDPPDEKGHRYPFHLWQPDGCVFHQYDSSDIRQCTEGRRIVVVGDSTSRHVAYAFSRLINRKQHEQDTELNAFPKLRDSVNLTYDGQLIQRLSNVYLNSHGNAQQEQEGGFVQNLDLYAEEKTNPPAIEDQEGPALIYMAAGLWFTNDKNGSRNVPWEPRFQNYQNRFNDISKFIIDKTPDIDPFTAPMDPYDGIGNQIFYGPASGPCYQGNVSGLIKHNSRKASEVIEMHNWLHETEQNHRIPILWSIVGVTTNQNKTWIDPLEKAAHVIDSVSEARANIVLNLRCNAKLNRMKRYHTGTCCTDYGGNQFSIIVLLSIAYLVACVICELLDLLNLKESTWTLLNMQPGSFVLVLLMCHFADRTQMMAKGSRLWEAEGFALLCAVCLAVSLFTIRRYSSKCPTSRSSKLAHHDQDEPFLSRSQTEEWKGWMQCFIMVYHWTEASKGSISIYILFRICVAAYLFQTGYGHTRYFIRTDDFSFARVAAILLRLNTLACALAYFVNTDYMFYHAAPCASFWFLVVYATMAIRRQYNSELQLLVTKVLVSGIVVSLVLSSLFMEWTFSFLRLIFNIHWSPNEWTYHITLDLYIVYLGIITAIIQDRIGSTSISLALRSVLALASTVAIFSYFNKTTGLDTSSYDSFHPFTSWIPILGFITLRNISTYTRNYHSRTMVWMGRHSLEISILQSHLLLAADRDGVLIIDGLFGDGSILGDRWRTLLVLLPIFIWTCDAAKSATASVVDLLFHKSPDNDDLEEPPFAWLKALGMSHIPYLEIRLAFFVLVMWLMNLLSPREELTAPPPGGHKLSIY
ncbi:10 TM acyl transferase domain found in Cas1p-domain-containing protein [Fusarium flagelliforme]|uniref:10 TM acyl transferase domain found in Cas1p-domain-containing protein n=1 Tax=Fusarium flagelliforme TaxID=2675880 RepID=UPI001E8CC07D|nr:10 TM acyl transferase domain found in Cas1p-domain-containing protein [Fusarium flagelliforme]KAH7174996.1 10 TM acyl transferase domain found in Cas1p-domain-containing protein [Fusarium flagelliforme]